MGTGGDEEPVIVQGRTLGGHDPLGHGVDPDHGLVRAQRKSVGVVPCAVMGDDFGKAQLARQHRREHDPIISLVGFGAEHRDVVAIGGALQKLLDRTDAGHAVSDNDELLARHRQPHMVVGREDAFLHKIEAAMLQSLRPEPGAGHKKGVHDRKPKLGSWTPLSCS